MTTSCTRLLFTSAAALALSCAPEVEPTEPAGATGGTGVGGSSGATAAGRGGAGGSGGAAGGSGGSSGGAGGSSGTSGGAGGTTAGNGGAGGVLTGGAGASLGGAGAGGVVGGGAGSEAAAGAGASAGAPAGGAGGASGVAGTSTGGAGTGSAGAAGSSGGSGGASAVAPSAGCGMAGRPSGGVVTVTNDHIYTFPTTYDGMTPFPLFIGMHAAGNPIEQFRNLTNGSAIETGYVRAFPKSAGNEWNYTTDIAKVRAMMDDLRASYCIDENRVFSSGHSSGAQMIVQILTNQDAAEHMNYKAVAPVAASNYGALVTAVPVLYIQGRNDTVRNSDGADVVARFRTANSCTTTSTPYAGVASCMSSGTAVSPGCIAYQGCSVPTVWCSHDDPQYGNTSHGVPCFAVRAMHDFFTSLP